MERGVYLSNTTSWLRRHITALRYCRIDNATSSNIEMNSVRRALSIERRGACLTFALALPCPCICDQCTTRVYISKDSIRIELGGIQSANSSSCPEYRQ